MSKEPTKSDSPPEGGSEALHLKFLYWYVWFYSELNVELLFL